MIRFALAAFIATTPALASDLRVIDGDTIVVSGEHVRVKGLDAPEIRHAACPAEKAAGEASKAFVVKIVRDAEIALVRDRKDRYGRTVADVSVNGSDLADAVIAAGYGVRWTGQKHDWCR